MKFKGDIIITDPCYIIKKDSEDWRKCDYGDNMAALGLTNYISESTRYGDWSCSTWSTPRKDVEAQLEELNALGRARWELMKQYGEDSVQAKIYDDKIADASLNIEKIGYFCADAGMVAVFLLDEVLKYNPDFDYHINREWTTTLIKDFDGEINYYVDDEDVKVTTWCRYSYEVEAETLEEAVELVKDGDVDSTDMEEFFESDVFLTPQENGGQPTHEIYLAKDDTLLYSNGDK